MPRSKQLRALGLTISQLVYEACFTYIEKSLVFLFNTSIETSQFPDSWKVARITPIFKDGDRTEKSNYRPISVLPVISKFFEKLVFNQLYQYMKENGLFTSDQSGFLRLHSTLTCLLKMSDDWYNGLDLGKLVGLVLIDLKKAFDTVDHDILVKKLELYGVQQRELSWFRSYLSNRKQFCRVNGVDSDVGDLEVGVSQGSCLGPPPFLVYINDIPQAVQASSVTMYADDTVSIQIWYQRKRKRMVQVILKWTKAVLFCKLSKVKDRGVLCGIPQGSCLGPLLFIVYLNDFEGCLDFSKANMYADDTHTTIASNDIRELVRMTKKELLNISDWLRVNKLRANPKKLNLWLLVINEE